MTWWNSIQDMISYTEKPYTVFVIMCFNVVSIYKLCLFMYVISISTISPSGTPYTCQVRFAGYADKDWCDFVTIIVLITDRVMVLSHIQAEQFSVIPNQGFIPWGLSANMTMSFLIRGNIDSTLRSVVWRLENTAHTIVHIHIHAIYAYIFLFVLQQIYVDLRCLFAHILHFLYHSPNKIVL